MSLNFVDNLLPLNKTVSSFKIVYDRIWIEFQGPQGYHIDVSKNNKLKLFEIEYFA